MMDLSEFQLEALDVSYVRGMMLQHDVMPSSRVVLDDGMSGKKCSLGGNDVVQKKKKKAIAASSDNTFDHFGFWLRHH